MVERHLLPTASAESGTTAEYPTCPRRGPLRALLLAGTGQDARLCANCSNCDSLTAPGMDLTIGEIIRRAARNETAVLTCTTLAACEDLLLRPIPCTAGLDLTSILIFLQREAELRGVATPEAPRP